MSIVSFVNSSNADQNTTWVVFDAVGTLIEAVPSVSQVYHRVGKKYGSKLGRHDVEDRIQRLWRTRNEGLKTSESGEYEFWKQFVLAVLDDILDGELAFRELFEHFSRPSSWLVFEDAKDVVLQLKQRGGRLAIASNFDQRLRSVIAGLFPAHTFEHLVISSEIGYRKPSADFYRLMLRQLETTSENVIFVGDDPVNDLAGPMDAGMSAFRIRRDSSAVLAENELRSLNEIPFT